MNAPPRGGPVWSRPRDEGPPPRRRVLTAQDVIDRVRAGERELTLAPGERLTPLARDAARENGVRIVEAGQPGAAGAAGVVPGVPGGGAPRADLGPSWAARPPVPAPAASVSPWVSPSPPAGAPQGVGAPGAGRITHVAGVNVLPLGPFPAEINRPEMDVRLRDVITGADGMPMAAGVLSLRQGTFPWHLDYDEIEYVIEGELHIATADQLVVGRPGDVIAVPRGTSITFGTPSWAKFLYVTYPADWQ